MNESFAAPVVSVVIPCFNAETTITDAIRSVQAQSLSNVEIIIVDDCSTDASRTVVEQEAAADPRVRLLAQLRNGGPAAARNRGFELARGKWVALLDADDLYHSDRLASLVAIAERRNADIVADGQSIVDIDGTVSPQSAFDFAAPGETIEVTRAFFFDHIWVNNGHYPVGLLKPIFRRDFVAQHKLAYDAKHRIGEDFLFYLDNVLAGASFYFTGDETYVYRQHSSSLSQPSSAKFIELANMCDDIVRTRALLLDSHAIEMLGRRKQGALQMARNLQRRELRELRRDRGARAVIGFTLRNPRTAFGILKTSLMWRLAPKNRRSA